MGAMSGGAGSGGGDASVGRGESGGTRLAIERAVRAAARAGNRLIAGRTAALELSDLRERELLECALRAMGARIAGASQSADFVFVDGRAEQHRAAGAPLSGENSPNDGLGLPQAVVGLDGTLSSARGSNADARIEWAARGMPATAALARALGEARADRRPRIAVSLVLEPKTAALARMLTDAGCEVAVFSAVSETDPEVAEALAADGRVAVFAPKRAKSAESASGTDAESAASTDAEHAAAILEWAPEFLIDDGSHLVRLAHTEQRDALTALRGAAEETTSGVRPLREMAEQGELRIPVLSVNDARTKTDFDNRIGTGQSCVFAIADVRDAAATPERPYLGMTGEHWVVIGYGPVGQGVARFAAALGARVTVVEREAARALSALHDGFEARESRSALPEADVVVSATGVWHTINAEALRALRPGTIVAVAGGIDDEIALDELRAEAWTPVEIGPRVVEWRTPASAGNSHSGPRVLAEGGGINYTAAEGNPIEVMDLSFATQLVALARLLESPPEPGVHPLTAGDEDRVARAALAAAGGAADPLPEATRAGGAAQPWTVHRYRASDGGQNPLHSSE
ncbi:adenosylhomocysteinase [Leucobacter sp. USHLN153]|uniref:adenosylhomocysteinase n=1 Tax=Leucobacter sp. USHLN153 TaxID=3081268 RepID=UPI003016C6E8